MYRGDSLSIRSVWAAYVVDSGVPIAVLHPRRDRFSADINGSMSNPFFPTSQPNGINQRERQARPASASSICASSAGSYDMGTNFKCAGEFRSVSANQTGTGANATRSRTACSGGGFSEALIKIGEVDASLRKGGGVTPNRLPSSYEVTPTR